MTDSTRNSDTDAGTSMGPDRGSPPRMPRWVKWPAIIIGVLILLFVVLQLTGVGGGMDHGPGAPPAGGH